MFRLHFIVLCNFFGILVTVKDYWLISRNGTTKIKIISNIILLLFLLLLLFIIIVMMMSLIAEG